MIRVLLLALVGCLLSGSVIAQTSPAYRDIVQSLSGRWIGSDLHKLPAPGTPASVATDVTFRAEGPKGDVLVYSGYRDGRPAPTVFMSPQGKSIVIRSYDPGSAPRVVYGRIRIEQEPDAFGNWVMVSHEIGHRDSNDVELEIEKHFIKANNILQIKSLGRVSGSNEPMILLSVLDLRRFEDDAV